MIIGINESFKLRIHCSPHRCRSSESSEFENQIIQSLIKQLLWIDTFLVNTLREKIRALPTISGHFLKNLNLFPSTPPSDDPYVLRTQRISTRLFLVLLVQSLIVLLIYTATVTVMKTFTVPNPSLDQYKQLYARYPSTLACPCRQVSIQYKTFVRMNYTLHEVCTSVYVTREWIAFIARSGKQLCWPVDFRTTGVYTFEALSLLCKSIDGHITASIEQFRSSSYVSTLVTSSVSMEAVFEILIKQFKISTTKTFVSSLGLISGVFESNTVPLATRSYFTPDAFGTILGYPSWKNFSGGCDCTSGNTCSLQSAIYQNGSRSSGWVVPGFYTACFVLESLRASTLACFYNETCLKDLQTHMGSELNTNFDALNSSAPSRFQRDSTIGPMLGELMVEQWTNSTTYDGYYAVCQPSECRYTLTSKNDAIHIVTTLIGLVGGLVTVLKFTVPRIVFLVDKYIRYRIMNILHSMFDGEPITLPKTPDVCVEDCWEWWNVACANVHDLFSQ